jgi:RNA polymerase sigma-70 factor (ECF subfamily)
MRRIGDLCEAEEITQETLLRAYQHRQSFATEDELMAWSTVVAQRLVIDRVRVRGRSVAVPEVPESARLGRDTADIVVARHEARAALESLEAIPTRQAAILWAREVEGLHYEEIAERFGITEPAVRSLLHRGRKALRKEFKDRTGSLPLNGLVPFAPWLLALKAAGKVRGAAKTVARSGISTTAAALSISALVVASGIGPFGSFGRTTAPAVRIDAGRDGSAYVTTSAVSGGLSRGAGDTGAPAEAPSASAARAWPRSPLSDLPRAGSWDTGRTCIGAQAPCLTGGDGLPQAPGGEVQIGPDLPDNPTNQGNVKVASDYIDCTKFVLPNTAVAQCHQYGPAKQPPTPPTSVATPSPSEGEAR